MYCVIIMYNRLGLHFYIFSLTLVICVFSFLISRKSTINYTGMLNSKKSTIDMSKDIDTVNSKKSVTVLILCVRSCPELVNFAKSVAQVPGYTPVIVEDKPGVSFCTSVKHVHVPKEELERYGYTQLNVSAIGLYTCAWCAALFYARNLDTFCWFLEEDVFMCGPESMQKIDASCPSADLVCASHSPPSEDWPHRKEWNEHRPFPEIYMSMVCACRMSPRLLTEIQKFAQSNGRLYFLEYFFNSLCNQLGLLVETPPELQTVVWKKDYLESEIHANPLFIYHPIKDISLHEKLRAGACEQ